MNDRGCRRALITGIGVLSPLGNDRQSFGHAVVLGHSGISHIRSFDTASFRTDFGGEVRNFEPLDHLSKDESERLADPYLQYALAAARQAVADAGFCWTRETPPSSRVALVVGTCNGGLRTAEDQYRILADQATGVFDHRMALMIRYHAVGKALSYSLAITGPTWITTTACASSTTALAVALEMIVHDIADTVLVGGADAICLATMAGFDALKATSEGRTSPFSMPSGLNLGEGAAFWIIEEAGQALARNATVEGELLSYALSCDAHHPTAPDPRGDGAFRTMSSALDRAGVEVADLGCVNAHGTGTDANDRAESKAISRLIGPHGVPVYSFKAQVGHCMGAAGILEATAGLLAMQLGVVPATINFGASRAGCGLDYVPNEPRAQRYDRFLSCNYAFGGNNAGVVVGKYDDSRPPRGVLDSGRQTVLTGGGVVCALGLGSGNLVEALRRGERGIARGDQRIGYPSRASMAGWVANFEAKSIDRRLNLRGMNLLSRYATAAARLALGNAGLRFGPKEGLDTGMVNGVYVGPSEEAHMKAVFSPSGIQADIAGFSQIVANATAGWACNALLLKGYSCTVSQGADAGLFAVLLAHLALKENTAKRILAGSSDELYPRYFKNYDDLEYLYPDEMAVNYQLRLGQARRRVLGEGAAYVVVENLVDADVRGARGSLALVGFGITTDIDRFYGPNTDARGLSRAISMALERAGWHPADVGLVIWSPAGNSGDQKQLDALAGCFQGSETPPIVTTVFNTGLCEASSGTMTLAAVIDAWSRGVDLWPQLTGIADFDGRPLPSAPVATIALATSELGFNLALCFAPLKGVLP